MPLDQRVCELLQAATSKQALYISRVDSDQLRHSLKFMPRSGCAYNALLLMEEGYLHLGHRRMDADLHFSGICFGYRQKHRLEDSNLLVIRYLPFGTASEIGEIVLGDPRIKAKYHPAPNYRDRDQNKVMLTFGLFPYTSVRVEFLPKARDEGRYERIQGSAFRVNPPCEDEDPYDDER